MGDDMRFLPRDELLSADEIVALAAAFVARGVRRIRLTGGEPLARRGAVDIAGRIAALRASGLDEVTLTTNGTRLVELAQPLRDVGIERINVSLDTLDPKRFRHVTRLGDLDRVLAGLDAAVAAGLHVKINTVAMRGINDGEIVSLLQWAGGHGHDLTLIETMPVGTIADDRVDRYLSLAQVRSDIEAYYDLVPIASRTGGPARMFRVPALGMTLGLITPMSDHFCDSCNRIRVSAQGRLYMCLGHEDFVDLRAALRAGSEALDGTVDRALRLKPLGHRFDLATPATVRHMSATGG